MNVVIQSLLKKTAKSQIDPDSDLGSGAAPFSFYRHDISDETLMLTAARTETGPQVSLLHLVSRSCGELPHCD